MSYHDGWAALNLEMPPRVPRTEYSAENHWKLVQRVTGINVDVESTDEQKEKARQAFKKEWNYDFNFRTFINRHIFGDKRTTMGHAEYAAGGVDYNDDIHSLVDDPEEALRFDPIETYGLPPKAEIRRAFEDDYKQRCRDYPDCVNMTGVYITLISGLLEILGWEMLLTAAGVDRDRFGELANRYAKFIGHYYEALAEADVPVVMIHDDIVWTSGPFIHPDWYRKYLFPNYKNYIGPLLESGKKVMYISDGNYTMFIDDLVDCGVHGFVLEPMTDMKYIAEQYGKSHVFIGNADTRILLRGSKAEIRTEVERCMNIGKDCPGFFMAVGNHIPPNTPVENALYYNEVYEELSKR